MARGRRAVAAEAVESTSEPNIIATPRSRKRAAVDDATPLDPSKRTKKARKETIVKAEVEPAKANIAKVEVSEHKTTRTTPRKSRSQTNYREADSDEVDEDAVDEKVVESKSTPEKSKGRGKKTIIKEEVSLDNGIESDGLENGDVEDTPKKKKKRKTKEEKEAEAMPLAIRTPSIRMLVGAHVSIAKGVENALSNAHHIGGNAFALFLKSQRKWDNPPLADTNRDAFISRSKELSYDVSQHTLPHGSYLVNLAQADPEKANQAYTAFLDDLHRCEALGIRLYNFHPGAACGTPLPSAITRLATQLNRALSATSTVIPVLENAAGSGTVIGSSFADLRDIIDQISPEHRSRIGVCIDTCHAFAAGYDLRSPETYAQVWNDFDRTVGFKYLKALHMNDSKAPLASKRDLHQNIGLGFLGLRAFHNVMNDPRFEGLPLILETPCEKPDPSDAKGKKTLEDKGVWAREIKLLESLMGMDVEGDEFKELEKELSEKGKGERGRVQKQVEEAEKKRKRKEEKGQKSLVGMFAAKVKEAVVDGEDGGAVSEEEGAETEVAGVSA
ncbi:MAG: hypothetical protein Q9227_002350 [Pyrenula ochraceoflavens]